MNQFLADYYGTGASGNDDADALEKMAQLTLLVKEAEEENIDLSDLSDDEVMELAEELYGGGDEGEAEDEDFEKEAAAKFEEADFLGRVMAHSMWQELDTIQKEAGVKDVASKGYESAKRGLAWLRGKTTGRVGKAVQERLERGVGGRTQGFVHRVGGATAGPEERVLRNIGKKPRTAETWGKGKRRLGAAAEIATGVGGAAALGGAGYGGYRGVKAIRGREKKGSALDALIEQRAIEHLASAGYIDQGGNVYGPEKTASDADFDTMVDRAALELLEQNGYPVQWR